MIRLLAILVAAGLIATGIAWLVDVPGGLDLAVGTYEFHTSASVAAGLLFFAIIVLFLLIRFAVILLGTPRMLSAWIRTRRARRGFQALSRGLVAAAAGDKEEAIRFARRGETLLGDVPLSLLLTAEAAVLDANDPKQQSAYRAMLGNPDTELLGLRGLFLRSMRKGDEQEALQLATRAHELRPKTAWAALALFDLHVSRHEWDQAQSALKKQMRLKLISADAARRKRAVALTAAALDAEKSGDDERSLTLALDAAMLAPALVPAAVLAARKLTQAGRSWKAQEVVEGAWAGSPHPDLASAYAAIHPTDHAATRARRFGGLVQFNPNHVESRLLAAEQAMALNRWHDARSILEPLTQVQPTARACVLMAEIAQAERGDLTAAQGWLARASRAPRDAQWRCARCSFVVQGWTPICANCGAFDSLSWTSAHTEAVAAVPAPLSSLASPLGQVQTPIYAVQAHTPESALLSRPPDDPGTEIYASAVEEEPDIYLGAADASPEGPLRRRNP